MIMIGHAGHPETVGTMGQLPEGEVLLVETVEDVAGLVVRDVAVLIDREQGGPEALAAAGYAAPAHDYRGHGRAEGRRGYVGRFGDYLDDVETMITREYPGDGDTRFSTGTSKARWAYVFTTDARLTFIEATVLNTARWLDRRGALDRLLQAQ
jgi:hypothetical protein